MRPFCELRHSLVEGRARQLFRLASLMNSNFRDRPWLVSLLMVSGLMLIGLHIAWVVILHVNGIDHESAPLASALALLTSGYLLICGLAVLASLFREPRGQTGVAIGNPALPDQRSDAQDELNSLFAESRDALLVFDAAGRFLRANAMAHRITGLSELHVGRIHFRELMCLGQMSRAEQLDMEAAFEQATAGTTQSAKSEFVSPVTGSCRFYECDLLPLMKEGQRRGVMVIAKDVTERVIAQKNERILKLSLDFSHEGVCIVDYRATELPIIFANPAFCDMMGYSEAELIGAPARLFVGSQTSSVHIETIRDHLLSQRPLEITLKSHRKDDSWFWSQVSLVPAWSSDREVTHYTAIVRDVTEKRERERKLAHQATHDDLTGLCNRAFFLELIERQFRRAQQEHRSFAVLFIDLDEFKPINDRFGHGAGDDLLVNVARRLLNITRPTDTLARLGGDEFVLLATDLPSTDGAEHIAQRALQELARPHWIGAHQVGVGASIGISEWHPGLLHAEEVLRQADMAMYRAKQCGRNQYQVFTESPGFSVLGQAVESKDVESL